MPRGAAIWTRRADLSSLPSPPSPRLSLHRNTLYRLAKMKVETCSFSGYKIYPGKVRRAAESLGLYGRGNC